MLTRQLEPEVMDTPEEAADYDSMDHGEVNRRFVADLLAFAGEWPGLSGGERTAGQASSGTPQFKYITPDRIDVLDLGTGTAQIPIELCRQATGGELAIVAADAAAEMLAVARKNVAAAGLSGRIQLQLVDAKRLPYADGQFGWVISNSIIHHIPEPRTVVAETLRVAAPHAVVFFRDLMRPDDEATLNRIVEMYAGGANAHQQKMFSDSLHAALSLAEIRSLVAEYGCDPNEVQATSDRHWTWAMRR